nr:MAG TPA: hypothetical protein [Caudoviricetes sp.]
MPDLYTILYKVVNILKLRSESWPKTGMMI